MDESSDVIILGYFNVNMMIDNIVTQQICNVYGMTNLITNPTCFKSKAGTLIYPIVWYNYLITANQYNACILVRYLFTCALCTKLSHTE